jgi:MIP family channel proteins
MFNAALTWGKARSIMGFRSDELEVPVIDTKAVAAEFLGTLLLVCIGCGTACSNGWNDAKTRVIVAFAFGMTLMVLTYALGHNSGGHFNVAVTVSLVLTEQVHLAQGIANAIGQFFGALIGAGILCIIFPCEMDLTGNIASNLVDPEFADVGRAIVAEAFGTFLLCFAVRETASTPKASCGKNACIAIGFAAFVAHLMLLPIDNCAINPMRATGPAIVSKLRNCENFIDGGLDQLWIMWVGPMIGALVSAVLAHPWWNRCAKKYRLYQ